jgi:uncharacterized RDD family membrane protein YckC|tara:strand:- start:1161 stop:1628 length:468 start_codon:yes stop_codon:yes gene_type:complete
MTTPAANSSAPLASLGSRFVATLIDFIIVPPVALFLMLASGVLEHAEAWILPQPQFRILGLLIVSYLLLNGYLLVTKGQTLGKRIMKIQIVSNSTDEPPPFWRLLVRAFCFPLLGLVPIQYLYLLILVVVEPVTIFGKSRRCLHDHLVGTRVLKL